MSPVPRQQLRSLIDSGRTTPVPGATDALSAKLIEAHGFEAAYIGSYATAASRYALPDTGLLTLDDLVAQARTIASAVSIPVMIHHLKNLAAILKKGADHAKARGIDPDVLINARLYPDMFPLVRQVQIATDSAKGAAARLAGVEVPSFPDTEKSFPELQARVARTVAFLKSVKPAQFADAAGRDIQLQMRMGRIGFDGESYLLGWALPNFYFHLTTAYDILRHNGVPLGKRDFLASLEPHFTARPG